MKIISVRRLRGPNVHLARPAIVARLRLDELTGVETAAVTGFPERLLQALPGLAGHPCAGVRNGFVSRLRAGTYFGHVAEHVGVELSRRIGREIDFGRTVAAGEPGLYDVIIECPADESPGSPLAGELMEAAVDLITAVVAGPPGRPLADRLALLAATAGRAATGPGTRSIIAAAHRRGIPVERFEDLSLLRLGWGTRRRLCWAATTDGSGGAVDIAADRQVTRRLLADAGVPVAPGGAAATPGEVTALLTELGGPVVLKPRFGRPGASVAIDLVTPGEVLRAYAEAGPEVVVERQLAGRDYRVLVVAGEVVAAGLSAGGISHDVTDQIHPDVARLCLRAAALVGLDLAGIDLRLADIAAPVPATGAPGPAGAGVVEVTALPGLRRHLAPDHGRPRDVGDAIVRAMFPGGSDGRIPSVAVTGTNGKTTVARLIAHVLAGAGTRVGLTCTDGVSIDGRWIHRADATGARTAQMVLGDPEVQAAVLETGRGGILRHGLGYDWTDVAVITNITPDHRGHDPHSTLEDVAQVKTLIAERVRDGGTLVLNADDPWVRSLAGQPRVGADRKRIVWFGTDPQQSVLVAHLTRGGTAYLLQDGWLVQATGGRRTPLIRCADLPGAFGGAATHAASNALAAAAAARALGAGPELVAERLADFEPRVHNPGRATLLRIGDVSVVVDSAHNPAAIAAVLRTLARVWGAGRCVAAVTLPGDRRDDQLAASAQVLADGVTRAVLYDDEDLRDRAPGEVPALVEREMRGRCPALRALRADGYRAAVEAALELAAPGDVVLVLCETAETMLAYLAGRGAVPAEVGLVRVPA